MDKKVLKFLTAGIFLAGVLFLTALKAQAGPSVQELSRTGLIHDPDGPFHLNTDRYKEAFQTLDTYLVSHPELPGSTVLIADNHGHFLRGTLTQWTYYTYGTHKGIEFYVHNPENTSQLLTVEIWLPKDQQWNMDKKQSYLSSFQQIEDFLTGTLPYRLDLVFQDNVPVDWGKGYCFKLDDESVSLSFTVHREEHLAAQTVKPVQSNPKPAVLISKTKVRKHKSSKVYRKPKAAPTPKDSENNG